MTTKALADLEAERFLIGSVLTGTPWEDAWDLESGDFYSPANATIWECIKCMMSNGVAPDTSSLSDTLMRRGELNKVGDLKYLMTLDVNLPFLPNVKEWARIVKERAFRRRVVAQARATAEAAGDMEQDAQALAMSASNELALLAGTSTQELKTGRDALRAIKDRQERIQKGEKEGLVPTGVQVYDHYLKGLTTGQLAIWGGCPGTGKTALKTRVLMNLIMRGFKVLTFELEDPLIAFIKRPVSQASRIQLRKLACEKLSDDEFKAFEEGVMRMMEFADNLYIEDRRKLTAPKMASIMHQAVKQHGVGAGFIDNGSEVNHKANKQERYDLDIDESVLVLRDCAITLDIPVVMLVHFTARDGIPAGQEPRNVRPTNRMWRNSGGYEQRARKAVGLWDDPNRVGFVAAEVTKQNEGAKDFTFYMPLDTLTGLVRNIGGDGPAGFDGSTFGGHTIG